MSKSWKKVLTTIGTLTGAAGAASAHHVTIKQMETNERLRQMELNIEERKQTLAEQQFEFEKEKWYFESTRLAELNKSSLNNQASSSQSKDLNLSSDNTTINSIYELDLFNLSSLNFSQFVGLVELLIGFMVFLSLLILLMEYIFVKKINDNTDKLPKWLKSPLNLKSNFLFINQLILMIDILILQIFNLLYGLFLFIYHHNIIVGSAGISILSFSFIALFCVYGLLMGLFTKSNNSIKDKLLHFKLIKRLVNYYERVNEISVKSYIIWLILSQLILVVFGLWLYLYGVV